MFSSFSSYDNFLNVSFFTDLGFLFKDDNFFKFLFSFSLLAISGLPPIIIFFYKYSIFLTLFFSNYFIFTSFIIVLNIISIVYYLKIIKNV
jgi:NADH:ubiquinone oxidoreductase subunit 2 (subunit N)